MSDNFYYTVKQPSHWLILTSITQLHQYLISPQQHISIICITNQKLSIPPKNKINIIFLDSQLQSKLSFQSTNIKNIAYLIAIKHGARFIYEYNSNISSFHPHYHHHQNIQHLAFRRQRSPFINIYPTFTANFTLALPGLPKDELTNITQDGWSSIRTIDHYQETIQPLIQQQLQIVYSNKLPFVKHPPVAIEPFTFTPLSDDNILFTYDAFWALVLSQSRSDIWRSWWVQRILWDINGNLLFSSYPHQINTTTSFHHDDNTNQDANVGKLVRFLSKWKSTKTTLAERIEELFNDMIKEKYCDIDELKTIQKWLQDLEKVKYEFPLIKTSKSQSEQAGNRIGIRRRRTAVCLTGLTECIDEAWTPTANAIRTHIGGEMDTFMYLSSTEPVVDQLSTVSLRTRLIEALHYSNFTVKVLFENIPVLDPHFPPNCTTEESIDQPPHKVPRYYQQLFGLSNCFSLVRDYEKKHNIKYDIMVRTRADIKFDQIPPTFDRESPYDINTTLIAPYNGLMGIIDDGFAVGPMDAVEVYMNRYYSFRECITRDLHPERYLDFYLKYRKVKLIVDTRTSIMHMPHSPKHCH
ncbi:unnamed protein product [Adineta steineri]|uniref:Uncharacterized protein n=1 Tax=Adineta steineri TaxID=433720 RepID=A0A818JC77_9BILA|nr:unnamed protein product [Adineta steineri]